MSDALAASLRSKGYLVEHAATETQIIDAIRHSDPNLLLLESTLFERFGTTLLEKVRAEHDLPVIMLAKRGDEDQVLSALEAGAEDFVMRPINVQALTTKMDLALSRFHTAQHPDEDHVIAAGPVVVDLARRAVTVRGQEVYFPKLEFELLLLLVREPRRVRTKDELLREFWPNANGDPGSLYAHVRRLRHKIELEEENPRHIRLVRHVGYFFDVRAGDDD